MESVAGSKSIVPPNVFVMTVSGEARKMEVAGLLSRRPVKFRLYEVMIEFSVPFLICQYGLCLETRSLI